MAYSFLFYRQYFLVMMAVIAYAKNLFKVPIQKRRKQAGISCQDASCKKERKTRFPFLLNILNIFFIVQALDPEKLT